MSEAAAGISRLGLLLIIFAVPFFVLPFAAGTMLRPHDDDRLPDDAY